MFNLKNFQAPPAHLSPGYFWIINHTMDAEELIGQLKDMAAHGARSVCMHPVPREFRYDTAMSPGYLTADFHRIVKEVAAAASELGMHWYLYDEGGWPSGSACGQVWARDPERFSRRYATLDEQGQVKIVKIAEDPQKSAPIPDLLAPGATGCFLELTHQAYAEYLAPYFGNMIRFTFTDEPLHAPFGHGMLAWTEDLPQEFLRRKGYELEVFVPDLLRGDIQPGSPIAEVSLDYREVLAELFEERFLQPLRAWCRKNNLLSGGHFSGEDQWFDYDFLMFGNILRSLRALDMPGVDMIWQQLERKKRLHPFPKLASSAGHQNGSSQILGEMFAIYGAGLQGDDMKFLLDYMLVCGVNTFVFSNYPMRLHGSDLLGGRPFFGEKNPLWKYFDLWHNYCSRMSALLTQGSSASDTALLLDLRSFQLGGRTKEYAVCRALKSADRLLEAQCDFDYIDDSILAESQLKNGQLLVGKMRYSRLVIPPGALFSKAGKQQIDKLKASGFPVFDSDDPAALSPLVKIIPQDPALRVCKRDLGNNVYSYFMLNTSQRELKLQVALPERSEVTVADPEEGVICAIDSLDGVFNWTFAPGGSYFFLSGIPAQTAMRGVPGEILQILDGSWQLRALSQYSAGAEGITIKSCHAPTQAAAVGDWRPVLGEDFSGDAVYSCDFCCSEPAKVKFIDLGKVCCAAAVVLNGKNLGRRLWSPFVFPVQDALQKGQNHLEITVSNTLANTLCSKEFRRYCTENMTASRYDAIQQVFEQESLQSGLLGPVSLRG